MCHIQYYPHRQGNSPIDQILVLVFYWIVNKFYFPPETRKVDPSQVSELQVKEISHGLLFSYTKYDPIYFLFSESPD